MYALPRPVGFTRRAIRAGVARRRRLAFALDAALMPPPPAAIARRCIHVDLSTLDADADYAPGEGFLIEAVEAGSVTVRSELAHEDDPDVTVTLEAGHTWAVGTLPNYAILVRNPAGVAGALTRFEAVFR